MKQHHSSFIQSFCLFATLFFNTLIFAEEPTSDLFFVRLDPAQIMQLPGLQQGTDGMLPPLWHQIINEIKKSGLPVKLKSVEIRAEGLLSNDDDASLQVILTGLSAEQIRYLLKYPLTQAGWTYTEKAEGDHSVFCIVPSAAQNLEKYKIYVHCQKDSKRSVVTLSPSLPKQTGNELKNGTGRAIEGKVLCPEGIFPYPA